MRATVHSHRGAPGPWAWWGGCSKTPHNFEVWSTFLSTSRNLSPSLSYHTAARPVLLLCPVAGQKGVSIHPEPMHHRSAGTSLCLQGLQHVVKSIRTTTWQKLYRTPWGSLLLNEACLPLLSSFPSSLIPPPNKYLCNIISLGKAELSQGIPGPLPPYNFQSICLRPRSRQPILGVTVQPLALPEVHQGRLLQMTPEPWFSTHMPCAQISTVSWYLISIVACQYPNNPVRKIWLPLRYINERAKKSHKTLMTLSKVVPRPKAKSGLFPATSSQVTYWLFGRFGVAERKRLFSGEQDTQKLVRVSCPLKRNLANSNPSFQALSHLPSVTRGFGLDTINNNTIRYN